MSHHNDCPSSTRRSFLSTGATLAAGAGIVSAGLVGSCASTGQAQDEAGRLDELFEALEDRSNELQPIQPGERARRRQRMGEELQRNGFESMLVGPCATMEYLTGVKWGRSERLFALIVLADGTHFWLCPAFEAEKAKLKTDGKGKPGGDIITWDEHEYASAPLYAELQRRRATRVCIEPSFAYTFVDGLAQEMGQPAAPSGRAIITELRGRKDAHELDLLRLANEITQQAIVAASECIRPGMTGHEIGALVRHAHTRLGLTKHWDLSLVGPAAAYPHGQSRDIEIKAGDMLLVDTGGDLHGYKSDNTRSWVFDGEPTERQARVWHAVHAAQRAAFEWIQPGARAGDADGVARRHLEQAGLTEGYSTFSHRLGHGIGMQGHEDPYFDSGSDVVLREGMTLSLEPGIYLYGEFGVRIEDIIAVNAGGAEHFGTWQEGPRSPR